MRILPMGRRAVLVEDPPGGPAAWAAGVVAAHLDGVIDVVPAAATVLVRCDRAAALDAAVERLPAVRAVTDDRDGERITIPVRYDGPDLDDVATAVGVSADEVIALHAGAEYRVAFCGFAPGFGYLTGLPERLHLPRRRTPRTSVPGGAVAIAAQYSAVYPAPSPGGWHLIGSTDVVLFAPERTPPALLRPGTRVTFEVVP